MDTLSAQYNDIDSVKSLLKANKDNVAAIIVEPVAGNMGCILPKKDFLQGLRELCDQHGTLLIFDEVITGFRIAYGGAFERFGVKSDLTTLGKILGGGMPVGAFGGSSHIMDHISPSGPVYQAGTLSGNPVAVASGIAVLKQLTDDIYPVLEKKGARLEQIIKDAAKDADIKIEFNRAGSMMGFFFTDKAVLNYDDAKSQNTRRFNALFNTLLLNGVSIAPSAFEVIFISTAHSDDILNQAEDAFKKAFKAVKEV